LPREAGDRSAYGSLIQERGHGEPMTKKRVSSIKDVTQFQAGWALKDRGYPRPTKCKKGERKKGNRKKKVGGTPGVERCLFVGE